MLKNIWTKLTEVDDDITDIKSDVTDVNEALSYKLIETKTGSSAISIASTSCNAFIVEIIDGSNSTIRFSIPIAKAMLSSTSVQYRTGTSNNGNYTMVIVGVSNSQIKLLNYEGYTNNASWNRLSTSIIKVYGR